jgi:hypothetical protein
MTQMTQNSHYQMSVLPLCFYGPFVNVSIIARMPARTAQGASPASAAAPAAAGPSEQGCRLYERGTSMEREFDTLNTAEHQCFNDSIHSLTMAELQSSILFFVSELRAHAAIPVLIASGSVSQWSTRNSRST